MQAERRKAIALNKGVLDKALGSLCNRITSFRQLDGLSGKPQGDAIGTKLFAHGQAAGFRFFNRDVDSADRALLLPSAFIANDAFENPHPIVALLKRSTYKEHAKKRLDRADGLIADALIPDLVEKFKGGVGSYSSHASTYQNPAYLITHNGEVMRAFAVIDAFHEFFSGRNPLVSIPKRFNRWFWFRHWSDISPIKVLARIPANILGIPLLLLASFEKRKDVHAVHLCEIPPEKLSEILNNNTIPLPNGGHLAVTLDETGKIVNAGTVEPGSPAYRLLRPAAPPSNRLLLRPAQGSGGDAEKMRDEGLRPSNPPEEGKEG